MTKKVLILGDSFVKYHSDADHHWLNLLAQHFQWSVDNWSVSGSGPTHVIDTVLKQASKIAAYDTVIFSWSEPVRFYHRSAPGLNAHEVRHRQQFKPGQDSIYQAADLWYRHMDFALEEVKSTALQQWFDRYLAQHWPHKQIYHFYSFPRMDSSGWANWAKFLKRSGSLDRQQVHHRFDCGVSVLPTLAYYSRQDRDQPADLGFDHRLGHLGRDRHTLLFNRLKPVFAGPYTPAALIDLEQPDSAQ